MAYHLPPHTLTKRIYALFCGLSGHNPEINVVIEEKGKRAYVTCARCHIMSDLPLIETTWRKHEIKREVRYHDYKPIIRDFQ